MRSDPSALALRRPPRADPVRFGILVEAPVMPRWQARCIEQLLAVEGAEAAVLVVAPRAEEPRTAGHEPVLWKRLTRHPSMRPSAAFASVDLGDRLGGIRKETCAVSVGAGGALTLDGGEASRLESLDLDFLLDLAHGGVRGVSSMLRSGVWAFRHGEPGGPDGGPAGFREILLGSPVIASTLVRLSGDGHGDRILHRGYFRTIPDSLAQSRGAVLLGVASWPARECRRLVAERRHDGPLDPSSPPPTNGNGRRSGSGQGRRLPPERPRTPTNADVLRFTARLGARYVEGVWRDLFRHEQWNVGVVDTRVEDTVDAQRLDVRWLPTPERGWFIADPFGKASGGGVHILAEEFDYESGRGRIASISLRDDGSIVRRPEVIPLPVHASYPYLFDVDGETYCIPETAAAREVRLFRARELPHDWEDLGVIVPDFAAADATLFRLHDRWWLFCVDVEVDPNTHLYAWWAPHLKGPWRPHLLNPVKTDPRSSRPAGGVIVRADGVYRPAQDCSETYGGAVVLNRILELSPETFREEPVRVIRPDRRGPFPNGVHTLSGMGSVTLVDGKRRVFVPGEFRRAVAARLGSLIGGR